MEAGRITGTALTSRIGLVITISTQFTEPYNTARQLNSLDWLSQGRIGWNVVTSFNGERNYGYDAIPVPAERYSRAAEYLSVTKALWNSTLRRFLVRYATSFGHFQIVGTAADAVEQITDWVTTGASDGFILLGGSSFDRIRDDVLPGLVDRGVFARDHAGATLRERLGTSTPGLPDGGVSRAAG